MRRKVGGIKKQIAEIIDKTWIKKWNFKSCVYECSHDYKSEMILVCKNVGREEERYGPIGLSQLGSALERPDLE